MVGKWRSGSGGRIVGSSDERSGRLSFSAQDSNGYGGAIYTRRFPRYYLQDFSLHLAPRVQCSSRVAP
jgi:hypothetical protein